jgi:hypothetical protein
MYNIIVLPVRMEANNSNNNDNNILVIHLGTETRIFC